MMKAEIPVRILQIGNGNFLRGFVDWIIQKANDTQVWRGSIHTVQIHSQVEDNRMIRQKHQFHVWTAGIDKGQQIDQLDLIRCVTHYTCLTNQYQEFLQSGHNPSLQYVISNTTEAGICYKPENFLPQQIPQSFPAKMTALLWERYQFFAGNRKMGLIFLPCELIEKNAEKLREIILRHAQDWGLGTDFYKWIVEGCAFYNTLVDRIVPGYPSAKISLLSKRISEPDELLVMAEPYHFWAIEGDKKLQLAFPLQLTGLNVHIVPDISPYRERKVRILNGSHTALVPLAYLKGLRLVRESANDPEMGTWLREMIFEEIIPVLSLDRKSCVDFAEDVLDRFRNPFIEHHLEHIALNHISKFRVRVLPSLLNYFEQRGSWPSRLLFSFAATILFYKGHVAGQKMPIKDDPDIVDFFDHAWKNHADASLVNSILAEEKLWGENLLDRKGLSNHLLLALRTLRSEVDN